ncbi:MAG: hypothetical protein NTW86_05715 [Candidatus Sumerlaeota bacterium]|nr:hypothetical protein [Candidatus Sumerlaeota bacterium]
MCMNITLRQNNPIGVAPGGLPHNARTSAFRRVAGLAALLCLPLCLVGAAREPTAELLQQMLQRFPDADLNKDGNLTVDEFREYRSKMQPGGAVASSRPFAPAANETPAAATNVPLAGKVDIQVTSAKPVPINPKIYGINCAEMFIYDYVQKPEYLSALGELEFNTFLFPGGSSRHHPTGSGGFNIRPDELAQSKGGTNARINKEGYPDFFQQYIEFMKPMAGHAVFIPNLGNGTLDELDYYLRKMTDARIPIETVVLGMEVQRGGPWGFENSAAYIAAIKPYIEFLKSNYPAVRIAAWSTPVGRRSAVPESYRQWNKDVAKVPGIDGFSQYGWTEFGSAATRNRLGGGARSAPEQRLLEYDAFVESFPSQQIEVYAQDWGNDKKMFMLQWGTHADRNTVLEGLHAVDFHFFMTEYNAKHDNYFEVATWSIPLVQDITSAKRKNSGGGTIYEKDIALWAEYFYAKPLRYLYSGDKELLETKVAGAGKNGAMEVAKALTAAGPDGKKYLCVLNRGPAATLGTITIDGKPLASSASVHVESASGNTLSTPGGAVKTFAGEKTLDSLRIEPYSITTMIIP